MRSHKFAINAPVVAGVIFLFVLAFWSLTVGSSNTSFADIWRTLVGGLDADRLSIVVWQLRVPRVAAAILAGAAFAAAGAIMQALTRNPLADSGLLGINAGAGFVVVLCLSVFGALPTGILIWVAMLGAAVAAGFVFTMGSVGRGGATPLKLILSGVIIGSFLMSLTTAILFIDGQTLEQVRFWSIGTLRNRTIDQVVPLLPVFGVGIFGAMILARHLNPISLGREIAAGLGQNLLLWQILFAALTVALAGSAVSLAGPLGFVGLVTPHLIRLVFGSDYRVILPYAMILGAILVLAADTVPRAVWGKDIPVGIMTTLMGAPFFIFLARRARAVDFEGA